MFNDYTKLKKELIEIKELLGIEREEYSKELGFKEDGLLGKVLEVADKHLAEDYFYECPCCDGDKYILKNESKKFRKVCSSMFGSYVDDEVYTTKENYKLHKSRIDEWDKEVEEFKKKNDN